MLFAQQPKLLERFRRGEPSALEEVYRAYVQLVTQSVAAALRRYGEPGSWRTIAAELADVVQEVFIRAFAAKTRERFDGIREYGPFLRQIAHHATVDYLRRKERPVSDVHAVAEELHPFTAQNPSDEFADRETQTIVLRYISELDPLTRKVHDALYIQGLPQRKAAEVLGVGRQVIRTVDATLREGLRRRLDPESTSTRSPVAQPNSGPATNDQEKA